MIAKIITTSTILLQCIRGIKINDELIAIEEVFVGGSATVECVQTRKFLQFALVAKTSAELKHCVPGTAFTEQAVTSSESDEGEKTGQDRGSSSSDDSLFSTRSPFEDADKGNALVAAGRKTSTSTSYIANKRGRITRQPRPPLFLFHRPEGVYPKELRNHAPTRFKDKPFDAYHPPAHKQITEKKPYFLPFKIVRFKQAAQHRTIGWAQTILDPVSWTVDSDDEPPMELVEAASQAIVAHAKQQELLAQKGKKKASVSPKGGAAGKGKKGRSRIKGSPKQAKSPKGARRSSPAAGTAGKSKMKGKRKKSVEGSHQAAAGEEGMEAVGLGGRDQEPPLVNIAAAADQDMGEMVGVAEVGRPALSRDGLGIERGGFTNIVDQNYAREVDNVPSEALYNSSQQEDPGFSQQEFFGSAASSPGDTTGSQYLKRTAPATMRTMFRRLFGFELDWSQFPVRVTHVFARNEDQNVAKSGIAVGDILLALSYGDIRNDTPIEFVEKIPTRAVFEQARVQHEKELVALQERNKNDLGRITTEEVDGAHTAGPGENQNFYLPTIPTGISPETLTELVERHFVTKVRAAWRKSMEDREEKLLTKSPEELALEDDGKRAQICSFRFLRKKHEMRYLQLRFKPPRVVEGAGKNAPAGGNKNKTLDHDDTSNLKRNNPQYDDDDDDQRTKPPSFLEKIGIELDHKYALQKCLGLEGWKFSC